MKKCPYCEIYFTPHVKVGSRQKTCGKPECKRALKAENNRRWREKNPDCCQDDYPRVKQWLDDHPGYLKHYRESYPGYVQKNRKAQIRGLTVCTVVVAGPLTLLTAVLLIATTTTRITALTL